MRLVFKAFYILSFLIILPGLQAQTLSDSIDVVKYSIDLDVLNTGNKTLQGKTTVDFMYKHEGLQHLTLELSQLAVDSVKNGQGEHLIFSRESATLRILTGALNQGDTGIVTVWYQGVPFSESWGGFHFSGSYAFNLGVGFESIPHNLGKAWFPCIDDFKDRALYSYKIRVNNGNVAVCGGILQSVVPHNDGTTSYYWSISQTIPTYLASIAIGPYALVNDVFNGIQRQIPVTYYVRPADTARAVLSFANLKSIMSIYEEKFGAYPFSRIGITGTALGAMEHAENISYPHSSINGSLSDEWLYAHELSHMWFGDMVTCETDADMWLNEGWARWCEVLFTEFLYGQSQAAAYLNNLHKSVLQNTHLKDGGYFALSPISQNITYGSTVYDKGGITVQALRNYMGDELFFPAVRYYLENYAFNYASSYNLQEALSVSSGMDLTGFFDFHVFEAGFNHVSIDSFRVSPKCGQYQIDLFMKQKLKGTTTLANDVRTEVNFMNENREIITMPVTFSGESEMVTTTIAFEPAIVLVDMNNKLLDATTDEWKLIYSDGVYDFLNTFCKLETRGATDTSFIRVTHNWVAPDTLKASLSGLTISENHFWTIEGLFQQGLEVTGRFSYNRNTFDGDILNNAADSLVILYRANAGEDWHAVDFTKTGPWQIGTIYVNNLKPGEYVLAVWDDSVVSASNLTKQQDEFLKVYPNPGASLKIVHQYHNDATLIISDAAGINVLERIIHPGEVVRYYGKPGMYIVSLRVGNVRLNTVKAIIK